MVLVAGGSKQHGPSPDKVSPAVLKHGKKRGGRLSEEDSREESGSRITTHSPRNSLAVGEEKTLLPSKHNTCNDLMIFHQAPLFKVLPLLQTDTLGWSFQHVNGWGTQLKPHPNHTSGHLHLTEESWAWRNECMCSESSSWYGRGKSLLCKPGLQLADVSQGFRGF